MLRHIALCVSVAALAACAPGDGSTGPAASTVGGPSLAVSAQGGRAVTTGTVYVSSQGLYYDTFVAQDPLPMEGHFQVLSDGVTEFGPGDRGYLGGRWWEDLNDNGIQDAGD